MQQALHILEKDIRHLWIEIAIMLSIAIAFAWSHNRGVYPWWALLFAAGFFLIVRVVQDEPIPGTNQFWVTRPYDWRSLLAAKLAFIVLFVNVPVFMAQLIVFVRDGWPILPHIGGLLWGLVFTIMAISLPVAAFASVTSGIMQFLVAGLITIGIGGIVLQTFGEEGDWPSYVEWVRYSVLLAPVIGSAAWTLFSQYRSRRTFLSRVATVTAISVALLAGWKAPRAWGLEFQAALSSDPFGAEAFRISLDTAVPVTYRAHPRSSLVMIRLPFSVTDIPNGIQGTHYLMEAEFVDPSGDTWKSTEIFDGFLSGNQKFQASFPVPRSFFDRWRDDEIVVRMAVHLAPFGNRREYDLALAENWVNVTEGLQCTVNKPNGQQDTTAMRHLVCRAPFRWPRVRLGADLGPEISKVTLPTSYSPFPTSMDLNVESRAQVAWNWRLSNGRLDAIVYDLSSGKQVTLVFDEPMGHLQRELAVTINAEDLVAESID